VHDLLSHWCADVQVEAAPKDKPAAEAAAAAAREQQARAQQENQRRKDKAAERKQKANQKRKAQEAERKAQEAAAKAEVSIQCSQVASTSPHTAPFSQCYWVVSKWKPVVTALHSALLIWSDVSRSNSKHLQASAAMAVERGWIHKWPQHKHAHHIIWACTQISCLFTKDHSTDMLTTSSEHIPLCMSAESEGACILCVCSVLPQHGSRLVMSPTIEVEDCMQAA